MGWLWRGLRRGIVTTGYPARADGLPDRYRGAVRALDAPVSEQRRGEDVCPTRAITVGAQRAQVDRRRCIQCGRCSREAPAAFASTNAFELAEAATPRAGAAVRRFARSLYVRHNDTGSDGSEEQELQAIFNPYYDANRLGIFLTASPRHADVLIVTGPVTNAMREPLLRTYEAMAEPKVAIALGTSACSGGMARASAIAGPVHRVIPVDVFIPGTPPPPLAILHGILLAAGRVPEGSTP